MQLGPPEGFHESALPEFFALARVIGDCIVDTFALNPNLSRRPRPRIPCKKQFRVRFWRDRRHALREMPC